jgi:hypothetical protein
VIWSVGCHGSLQYRRAAIQRRNRGF